MTRETAIALLNNLRAFAEDDDEPAIDMAIEVLSTPSGDLISRADAIGCVDYWIDDDATDDAQARAVAIKNALRYMPSADAAQGKWIYDGQNFKGGIEWCHCSKCGKKMSVKGLSMYNFCPNCGARMRGGAE